MIIQATDLYQGLSLQVTEQVMKAEKPGTAPLGVQIHQLLQALCEHG